MRSCLPSWNGTTEPAAGQHPAWGGEMVVSSQAFLPALRWYSSRPHHCPVAQSADGASRLSPRAGSWNGMVRLLLAANRARLGAGASVEFGCQLPGL